VRAVDTNILARYYLQDDPAQSRVAVKIIANGDIFVPKTVVLELEWVLRYVAAQPAKKVLSCLAHLVALPGITIEDHAQIETALTLAGRGFDFADALHLAASHACSELLTFDDRGYARRAARAGIKPVVRVPRS
jgi:predicted nucleic-acid-binding protein